ncbi:hypothetical protein NE237_031929 [Protea cynaroides]|uniref:Uncharacterized protein n=1 Tax=Protea cynaroides TaxID=273540 RepID=A0A9Q0L2C5_9MAGN|nr:hypothetical protein NE237_031929 [Protea cynaroides]
MRRHPPPGAPHRLLLLVFLLLLTVVVLVSDAGKSKGRSADPIDPGPVEPLIRWAKLLISFDPGSMEAQFVLSFGSGQPTEEEETSLSWNGVLDLSQIMPFESSSIAFANRKNHLPCNFGSDVQVRSGNYGGALGAAALAKGIEGNKSLRVQIYLICSTLLILLHIDEDYTDNKCSGPIKGIQSVNVDSELGKWENGIWSRQVFDSGNFLLVFLYLEINCILCQLAWVAPMPLSWQLVTATCQGRMASAAKVIWP